MPSTFQLFSNHARSCLNDDQLINDIAMQECDHTFRGVQLQKLVYQIKMKK